MSARLQRFEVNSGVAIGAVLGTVLRFVTMSIWPEPSGVFATSLLIVGLSGVALGIVSTIRIRSLFESTLLGLAGAAASLSLLAMLAISSNPLLCIRYAVCCPICAVGGLALGVAGGLTMRGRAKPVVVSP
jgi:hypothetical protein